MSLMELLSAENIDLNDKEKVALLQKFYQEGYMQGCHDKNPNYEYSLKYKDVVSRVFELFDMTVNPIGLSALEDCLDVVDKYKKEHPSLFWQFL